MTKIQKNNQIKLLSNLPDKEVKVTVIKIFTRLERRMNKVRKHKKVQIRDNTKNEMKITLEGINSRSEDAKEEISDLEDRIMSLKWKTRKKK